MKAARCTMPACFWLLLLLLGCSSTHASVRSLKAASGCSGSVANTLVAALSTQGDSVVSFALGAAWPSVHTRLEKKLASIDITKQVASKSVSLKKCAFNGTACVGFTAKLDGSVRLVNGTVRNLSTPSVHVTNITCAAPASALSLTASGVTASLFNISAESITMRFSGSVVATASTLYLGLSGKLTSNFNGTLTFKGLKAQARANANVNGTYSLSSLKLTYTVNITSIQHLQLDVASASYAGSRLSEDESSTYITKQVEEYVSGLMLSANKDFISQQMEDALNGSLGDATYKNTIKF